MKSRTDLVDPRILLAAWLRRSFRTGAAIVASLMIALVFSGCGKSHEEKAAAATPPPVPVVVASVIQKTVPIYTEYTAQADARDTVELRARVESFLEKVHFEEGRPVKK